MIGGNNISAPKIRTIFSNCFFFQYCDIIIKILVIAPHKAIAFQTLLWQDLLLFLTLESLF